ncbi:hypothetical protein [Nitrosomonas sp.]|uniref:hypothetical protein n=1 Tax=Nitrosomonas sp. TaxID=42353 RepID=UPI002852587F|nr:hypothetical protein [Nitrosomonas sp.]
MFGEISVLDVKIDYKGPIDQLNIQAELENTIQASFEWLNQYIIFNGVIDVQINVDQTGTGRFSGTGPVHEYLGKINGVDTWENASITESRTGIDVDPNAPEYIISIDPNSSYLETLWWNPTPHALIQDEIPANKIDAFSVVLHEILHGMGISGWLDWNTGKHTGNYQSIWDSFITIDNGQAYFTGPNAVEFLGEYVEVRLGGSQGAYHLGSANTHQPFLEESIMNSYHFIYGERYLPGQLEFSILEDLGWILKSPTENEISVINTDENVSQNTSGDNHENNQLTRDGMLVVGSGDDILDGGEGNDELLGYSGNDVLKIGFGHDEATGGEGNDIFYFYAPGHFVIHDFDPFADLLVFDSEKTGLHTIHDLLSIVTHIEDNETGVIVHFVKELSSITMVGLHPEDLSVDMAAFI